MTFLSIFKNKSVRKSDNKRAISQFQSACTALAATLGTGNIVGVATAIALGGPGSIFWMWVSAFFGMMTSYAENTLGIKYRFKGKNGEWVGGAMYYMERGLNSKWLAAAFSLFCMLAAFGMGNMAQANGIAAGLKASFGVSPVVTAIVITAFTAPVILGGIKRIAGVTEKLVPFIAIFYILGGIIVIAAHADKIAEAFVLIIGEALKPQSAAGGFAGYGIAAALRRGVSRGVFTNEAGLGSSVMAHSATDIDEPVVQGMWGIFEVFLDTIVICTVTALAILTSGAYSMAEHLRFFTDNPGGELPNAMTGVGLTSAAFDTALPFGGEFVTIAITLFAYSTILGWSYFGERAASYLFGHKAVIPYKIAFIAFIAVGCLSGLNLVWDISDTFNGLMAIPNLISITLLSGQVIKMTNDYTRR
jgi:AGCS family alanine or glycine:cation symporter